MMIEKHFNISNDELNAFIKIAAILGTGMLTILLLVLTINQIKSYSTIGDESGPNGTQNTITVSGEADMDVQPDITTFNWTVDEKAKTVADANSAASTKENAAIAYLKSRGVADSDIKTTDLSTNEYYASRSNPCTIKYVPAEATTVAVPGIGSVTAPAASGAPAVMPVNCGGVTSEAAGYETTETVQVTVRNIQSVPSKTGTLVSGLTSLGISVSNPESTVENPDSYKEEVRSEAILKARQQAEVLARDLGVSLVKVVGFSENSYFPTFGEADGMVRAVATPMAAPSPDLPTGTNKISSNVSVTYEIQ